jgi:hypothetical protein
VLFSLDDDNDDNVTNDSFSPQAWERVATQWRVVGGSSIHNTVEVNTNNFFSYILDRVFINSWIDFCPKAILPPTTTMDDPPPLPWCELNTHLKNMCF